MSAVSLAAGTLLGATNTYSGAADGDWFEDSNWSLGQKPTADDDVVIASTSVKAAGSIVAKSLSLTDATLSVGDDTARPHVTASIGGDVTLAGTSKLYVYAGELTDYSVFATDEQALAAIRAAANVVTVGGNFSVGDTSVVYPDAARLTGVPVIFRVGGNFVLAEGAMFDVKRRGWTWSSGAWADHPTYAKPRKKEGGIEGKGWTLAIGSGLSYDVGARYGNDGGSSSTWTAGGTTYYYARPYGEAFAPIFPGSPGGSYTAETTGYQPPWDVSRGPGSIVVLANGTATVDGVLDADAIQHVSGQTYDHAGTSGGGIWLAASQFTFGQGARLTARGGTSASSSYGHGGGGRIAVAEACTAAQIEAMLEGTLPDGVSAVAAIGGVATSVAGGSGQSRDPAPGGSVRTVRPEDLQTTLTTRSAEGGLVIAGVILGEAPILAGPKSYTAPQYATLALDSGVRYACAGYVVSNATAEVARGTGLTASFEAVVADGPYELVWLWKDREALMNVNILGSGSVTYASETHTEPFSVYLPSGEAVSFLATAASGWKFSNWAGAPVPGGIQKEAEVTVSIAATSSMSASFSEGAMVRRWKGGADTSWTTGTNWEPLGVPGPEDDVYMTNATVTVGTALELNKLVIAGNSKVTFNAVPIAGESTEARLYSGATVVRIKEAMEVVGTTEIVPAADPVTGTSVKFDVGSFTLGAGARINANGKGWYWYTPDDGNGRFCDVAKAVSYYTRAFGAGESFNHGAGYGGEGKQPTTAGRGHTYGQKYAPFLPGSPNGIYNGNAYLGNSIPGGGSVWIKCSGLFTLDGVITASAGSSSYGGASGGGVWLAARGFRSGSGASVSANGGTGCGYNYSMGGGGRVALAIGLTDEELDALAAGETPDGLAYADTIDAFPVTVTAGCTGGQVPTYGNAGTMATVTGALAYKPVVVTGTPLQAVGISPSYGTQSFPGGTVQTFAAPKYGTDPADSLIRYACLGYTVTDVNGDETSGSGTSVDVTIANTPITVCWRWGAAQYAVRMRKPDHAALKLGGVLQAGDAVQWTTGALTPVEVVPDEGYEFVCWQGKVPCGLMTANPLSFSASEAVDVVPLVRPVAEATTRTWTGTGLWTNTARWNPAGLPGPQDTLVIASGTCTVSNALVAVALQMTGGTLKVGGEGDVNAEISVAGDVAVSGGELKFGREKTMQGNGRFVVGGNFSVSGSAKVTLYGGKTDDAHDFATGATTLDVGGAFTLSDTAILYPESDYLTGGSVKITARSVSVGTSAQIEASQRGYRWLNTATPPAAPGLGYSYDVGGSYGGQGGNNQASSVYGFANAPIHPGSPNGCYNNTYANCKGPGGLIRLHARTMNIEGALRADADLTSTLGGPSGGGIWLTADKFAFGANAVLSARGGRSNGGYYSNGGGGRIAVCRGLSQAQIDHLAATGEIAKRAKSVEQFRADFQNDTMTVDVTSLVMSGTAKQVDHPGTFTYFSKSGLMLIVR